MSRLRRTPPGPVGAPTGGDPPRRPTPSCSGGGLRRTGGAYFGTDSPIMMSSAVIARSAAARILASDWGSRPSWAAGGNDDAVIRTVDGGGVTGRVVRACRPRGRRVMIDELLMIFLSVPAGQDGPTG